jgi:hypothetical protein
MRSRLVKRTFSELQVVELTEDVGEDGRTFSRGTVGTIVHIHDIPEEAYLVELSDNGGESEAILTLLPTQVRAIPSEQ